MREIKLRAWDKKLNKMWEPVSLLKLLAHLTLEPEPNSTGYKAMRDHFGDLEWLQFTGLLDKNGKEIYEGDVVVGQAEGYAEKMEWRIVFDEGRYMTVNNFDRIGLHYWEPTVQLEVVGNIYENPDMVTP